MKRQSFPTVHKFMKFYFSVGYSKDDVEYRWTKGRGVNIASDMKMSQFDLIKTPTGNATVEVNKGKGFSHTCQNG